MVMLRRKSLVPFSYSAASCCRMPKARSCAAVGGGDGGAPFLTLGGAELGPAVVGATAVAGAGVAAAGVGAAAAGAGLAAAGAGAAPVGAAGLAAAPGA